MEKSTEQQIIDRIREALASDPEKTQAGLARAMGGLQHSAVSRLLSGERRLKAGEIPAIEEYLGTRITGERLTQQPKRDVSQPVRNLEGATATASHKAGGNDLPIKGAGENGRLLFVDDLRFGYTERPDDLVGVDAAFALVLPDESLGEVFIGTRIIVDPRMPVRNGKLIVIVLHEENGAGEKTWICRTLVGRGADGTLTVRRHDRPDELEEIPAASIAAVHAVHSLRLA